MKNYQFMSFKGALNIVINSLIIILGIRLLMKVGMLPNLSFSPSLAVSGVFNPVLTQQADTSSAYGKYINYTDSVPAITRKSVGFFTTR